MPPGLQPGFLRLGCRRTISHCRLRTEPRRLVVHSRWSHFRYSAYPSRLPGTPDVPVPLATDWVCVGRRFVPLYVPGTCSRTVAETIKDRGGTKPSGYFLLSADYTDLVYCIRGFRVTRAQYYSIMKVFIYFSLFHQLSVRNGMVGSSFPPIIVPTWKSRKQ